ncbi:hypothetical protein HIM_07779 [Hirsutella minnesotensis 3608]|uniref:Peptide hydrolase n=1 Tax=Hirsutella minnesotensis 3608 TaxID=1043627 RepID=A0A0F7ZMZ0_9HYPO|nr:hypothetical protein HIM_07779 [Hirsutella minnesotensis 3608]
MRFQGSLAVAALVAGAALAQTERLDPAAFAQEISREELEKHALQLNAIAKANFGNRGFGTPGYLESRDYRGGCVISEKLTLAKRHGAVAVVVYNQSPREAAATAGSDDIGKQLPGGLLGVGVGHDVGREWSRRLGAGETFPVAIVIDHNDGEVVSWNIMAESKSGDPDNVVMLGAHLDSVQSGPGVNDDGSGTSALLDIMAKLCHHRGFKNKVRFAWWGAEELGLVGSNYYASQLGEADADRIRFYFNYDMIGSPSPNWTVYANTDADRFGARHLYGVMSQSYSNVSMSKFAANSDYVAFRNLGIPASGIFSGADAVADPCYHQACDDRQNINLDATLVAARAAAFAMAELANGLEGLPVRDRKRPSHGQGGKSLRFVT